MLDKSKNDLEIAGKAIKEMKSSKSLKDFQENWQIFLFRIERAWEYIERTYKDGRFQRLLKPYRALRKSDQLLRYLFHARHVETHALCDSVVKDLEFIVQDKYGRPFHMHGLSAKMDNNNLEINIDSIDCLFDYEMKVIPTRPYFNKIKNRGRTYKPPVKHLGNYVDDLHPIDVAQKGLDFYKGLVSEIEEKLKHGDIK
ncbi:hypothetical protein ACFL3P_03915 [Pseudomonadota bacterium]